MSNLIQVIDNLTAVRNYNRELCEWLLKMINIEREVLDTNYTEAVKLIETRRETIVAKFNEQEVEFNTVLGYDQPQPIADSNTYEADLRGYKDNAQTISEEGSNYVNSTDDTSSTGKKKNKGQTI